MAHHTIKSGYERLVNRLNRFPQGAPPSRLLYKILKILFREREAELISLLPIKPFTAKDASRIWKLDLPSTQNILQKLAGRALLVDIDRKGESVYALPPPMAGFFEFSLMRVRGDVDQKVLAQLYHQYINVEEDFIRSLFLTGETQQGRVFVNESVLPRDNALHVLDYERASEVIQTASHIGVSLCYCRHKMEHLKRACRAPMNICMTFNTCASSLVKHGFAKKVDASKGMELLHEACENNLVQFGENVREEVNFICHCCACCCEAMIAARRFGILHPVHTTNFIPEVDSQKCIGCGLCAELCPVEAMKLIATSDPKTDHKKRADVDEETCLGCGVCIKGCKKDALSLESRPKRVITPLNSTHRIIVMAIERGKLQHLIFDNQVLWSHRALAALLGVILKLPPIKQTLANSQIKSRYLEKLIRRYDFESS